EDGIRDFHVTGVQTCALPIFIPLNDGSEYVVKLASVAEWEQAYPRLDVMAELRKARAWCVANPRQRKTRGGAAKFLNGWLSRASERATPPPAEPSKASLPGGGWRKLSRRQSTPMKQSWAASSSAMRTSTKRASG